MTKKKAKPARKRISNICGMHLLEGCCLLGCGCEVCTGPPSYALRPHAKETWELHRDRLLAIWRDEGETPEASGFGPEGRRGAGRWIPSFGEVVFDGFSLPKQKAEWPAPVRKLWRSIKENLEALKDIPE
jgi:hypothetical protein